MSQVLDIDNLLESPLADLHAIAGELEIEGYRTLRKPDLTIAILESRGEIADEIRPAVESKAAEIAALVAEREKALAEKERQEEEAREAAAKERDARAAAQRKDNRGERQRGGGGRQNRQQADRGPRARGGKGGAQGKQKAANDKSGAKNQPDVATVPVEGVFEPGSGGGGRLRTEMSRRVRADADVPRGEVRRWGLKRGDLIRGEAKKLRRGRTDFAVVTINSVNGCDSEQKKKKLPRFTDIESLPVGQRYAKKLFKAAPIGAGSRTVVTGPTRAVATEMLLKLAEELASAGVTTTVVVVAPRPEQSASDQQKFELVLAKDGKPVEDCLPAIELVLERNRRLAETGGESALLIDGLDLLAPEKAGEIFMAARNLKDAGALTIACSAGAGSSLEAQATSIGFVSSGRRLKLDKKSSWSQ